MTIKMLRSLARRPDRLEGQVVDVPDDEAHRLVRDHLAEPVEQPKPPAPPAPPKK